MDPNKKILLVEDDSAILKLLEFIFKKDYIVTLAINGKEALEKVNADRPDIIISDIMMPEMTGLEFKQQLNLIPDGAKIPFIFLSAMSDKQTIDQSVELGASAYFVKPVRPGEIKDKVKNLLELED